MSLNYLRRPAKAGPANAELCATRVALVHDYLVQMGGAERVVASMQRLFPTAPIFTSATDFKGLIPELGSSEIINSFLQHIPALGQLHKAIFPLYPLAFRSLDLSGFDVALISSSGFSKWVNLPSKMPAVCYCHAPPRFIWDTDSYLENEVRSKLLKRMARGFILRLRDGDLECARRMDHFIANSNYIRQKIRTIYQRDAEVIYPPVAVDDFTVSHQSQDYYLILSRLVAYKQLEVAIRAFGRNGRKLILIGDGPDRSRLESIARSYDNIRFLGWQPRGSVRKWLSNAYAVVTPSLDDFGIVPVEANASGKPVLAYGMGGVLETIVAGVTGEFFSQATEESINDSLARFEARHWDPERIRSNAERFSEAVFLKRLQEFFKSHRLLQGSPPRQTSVLS